MGKNRRKNDVTDLCNRCGDCCRLKVLNADGRVEVRDSWCPHFSFVKGKGSCDIYERHLGSLVHYPEAPGKFFVCRDAEYMFQRSLLPNDCPYALRDPLYRSRVDYDYKRPKKGKENRI